MQEATQELVRELEQNSTRQYVSAYSVAKIYASVSDSLQTFTWLEKAYKDHDPDLIELKIEPNFAGVRSDPRFTQLLADIGFSPS